MSAENKAIVRRFTEEVLNGNNRTTADELFAPDFKFYFAGSPEAAGREEFAQALAPFRAAFPDFHYTIEDLMAEGDRVAARFSIRGTHRGELFGLAATGRQARWGAIAIFRIAAGKVVAEWPLPDIWGVLRQLGGALVPAAEASRRAT